MDLEKRIAELVKNGYTKNQAYLIAKTTANKQYAQQAIDYNKEYMAMTPEQEQLKSGQFNGYRYGIPQAPNFTFNPQMSTPQNPFENTGYANYAQDLNQQYPLPQSDFRGYQQYNTLDPNFKPSNALKPIPQQTTTKSGIDTTQQRNEVNILNPFTGVDSALMYAGQGFGEKDPWKAGLGTSLSLLKGARGFMSGYANGKESRRVAKQNEDAQFKQNRNYQFVSQQGGKLTNAENLTGQFVADEGVGNVNMEDSEFIKRTTGQVQQVVGEKHVRNGKEAEGVDVNLEEGDKTLSNTKILPIGAKNAKELKDRYNITVKAKDTFASVQKKVDLKIGYKKETEKLASWIEKFGNNEKLKDKTTKELNAPIIEEKMLASKAKIEALNEVRGMVFEDLYARQEQIPKKGKPGDLFTDSGKLVTEKNEGVAQQGGEQQDQATALIQAYAEASGQDPQALIEQISQMQPEEQAQALQQMAQELQVGQEQEQSGQEEQQEMQQGGLMDMASKYGISLERAQELISMQQGGYKKSGNTDINVNDAAKINEGLDVNFTPEFAQSYFSKQTNPPQAPQRPIKFIQPVSTEGYRDNGRLSPGDYQKVYYTDPRNAKVENQDYEYLNDSGYDELKRMNNYKLYMEQKNRVAPQNNQIAQLQQGGEKQYAQQALSEEEWLKKQGLKSYNNLVVPNTDRLGDNYRFVRGLGYEGKKDIGSMQKWMRKNYPDEVVKYFTEDGQPLTAKHVDIIKSKYNNVFKDTGISPSKKSEDYTVEEKLKLQKALGDKANKEFLLEGFEDKKWDWRFPMVGTNLQAKGLANTPKPQAPSTTTDMSKFYSTPTEVAPQTQVEIATQKEKETVDENRVKNYIPSFPTDLRMPPSALAALNKPYVPFGRQEPIKATVEPMLAEQERLRQSDLERINQTGLSAQQMEALSATGLASSQMAANDAIGKVENFNAQNQFQTDQFNIGQRTKEDMANAEFSQKYQNQMLGSMANTERDWRNFYTEGNLQNRANYNYVNDLNKVNTMNDQYAIVPGRGVIFKNNQSQDMPLSMSITQADFDKLSAEERWKLLQEQNSNYSKQSQRMKNYKSATT